MAARAAVADTVGGTARGSSADPECNGNGTKHAGAAAMFTRSTNLVLALLLGTTACSLDSAPDSEQVEATRDAIIDGVEVSSNSFGAIALYHKKFDDEGNWVWWPRPCSARVLNPSATAKRILTARHCVTKDGTIAGTEFDHPTELRVTGALKPGPTRPADALQPQAFVVHPSHDLALISVQGDLKLPSNVAVVGMNVTPTNELEGFGIAQYGYGWGTEDKNSTTGILRMAQFFGIGALASSGAYYSYDNNPSLSGGSVTHGDSGGPAIFTYATGDSFDLLSVVTTQVGVHSTGAIGGPATDATIAESWDDFLMPNLGAVYLRSAAKTDRRMNVDAVADEPVRTRLNTSTANYSTFAYTIANGRIRLRKPQQGLGFIDTPFCLATKGNSSANGTPIVLKSCNAASTGQIFSFNAASQLQVQGKCVKENTSNELVLASCVVEARQRWIVDPDPRN
jgi:hypothetical protein